jgi:drug/metabolite transporter (DMT)-like permease
MNSLRTLALTTFALVAFAANSVLCRLALGEATIDAASFSTVRLVSGALTLLLLSRLSHDTPRGGLAGDWVSAAALFLYAVPFSFAYVSLGAGTGALILFGAVQATMILAALWSGERPVPREWVGVGTALAGLIYLVFPGVTAPTPLGSTLMSVAGIAWGVYSIRGRGIRAPLAVTTGNFVRTTPFALGMTLILVRHVELSASGLVLAAASGAVASGIGYAIWYSALRGLTVTRAALVQLAVPLLAAVGGVVFLAEAISSRLLVAACMILGGVALAVVPKMPAQEV